MQVSKVNNQVNGIAKIKLMIWVWDLAHACVAFMAGQYAMTNRNQECAAHSVSSHDDQPFF